MNEKEIGEKRGEIIKIYVYADHVVEIGGLHSEVERVRDDIVALVPEEEKKEIEKLIRKKIIDAELDYLRKILNELQFIKENLKGGKK